VRIYSKNYYAFQTLIFRENSVMNVKWARHFHIQLQDICFVRAIRNM